MLSSETVIVKPAQSFGDSDRCLRCRGLTVIEDLCEGTAGAPGWELTVRRCVICGDVVDPMILEHRVGLRAAATRHEAVCDAEEDVDDSLDQEAQKKGERHR